MPQSVQSRLPPQPWMTSNAAARVMTALNGERADSARFVGGCVRNALLDEPVADIDIATQLTPDVVEHVMRAANIAVHPTGIEHGTLTVVANHIPFEVTTLRRDVETDGRRATVAFTEDWAEDAQRRDFRMNALYVSADGELHDPTGGGLGDIRNRRIVFVGDPETRIREDYLRILRFFRFNAWYGHRALNADGLNACGKLRAGLAGISAERIWMETRKLMAAPDPLPALKAMAQSGVLEQLFPDAHDLDLLERLVAIETGEGIKPDPLRRFMSMFSKDPDLLAKVARRLKMANEERDRIVFAARHAMPVSPELPAADLRRALYRAGQDIIRDRALLAWASRTAELGDWSSVLKATDDWVRPVMPVRGEDVMALGVQPGPAVGAALRKLEDAWMASDFSLEKAELLGLLRA